MRHSTWYSLHVETARLLRTTRRIYLSGTRADYNFRAGIDPVQVARDVVAFRETVEGLAGNEFLGDLPFEFDAMGTVLGHGFHPLKARQSPSIPNLQDVHRQGRTPAPELSHRRLGQSRLATTWRFLLVLRRRALANADALGG